MGDPTVGFESEVIRLRKEADWAVARVISTSLEPHEKKRFLQLAQLSHKTVAELVRLLIRQYIEEHERAKGR